MVAYPTVKVTIVYVIILMRKKLNKHVTGCTLDRFIVKSCSKPHRTKFGNAPTQDGLNCNAIKNYPSCVDINRKKICICESDTYIVYVLLLIGLIFIALYTMFIV